MGAAALATALLCLLGACGGAATTAPRDAAVLDGATPPADAAGPDAPDCPASCDDNNTCTVDSCDPVTHLCVHAPVANATSCEDGSACTVGDVCQDGLCFSGPFKICKPLDQCHLAGVCSPRTGECTNPIAEAANTPCDDGVNCTTGDHCAGGVCLGTPIVCDGISICNEAVGICVLPDGGSAFPTASLATAFQDLSWIEATDGSAGSVFATGLLKGTTDLGAGPLDSGGANNVQILVARFDPTNGRALWSQSIGDATDPQQREVNAIGANGADQVAILGPLSTMAVFGTQVAAVGVGDFYILAADAATGAPLWLRGDPDVAGEAVAGLVNGDRLNLGKTGQLTSLAGDPGSDTFVFCGTVSQKAINGKLFDSNPYSIVHHGGTDVVVGSISGTSGKLSWAQQFGGTNNEECSKVAVDSNGNIYVAGTYTYGSTIVLDGQEPLSLVDKIGATGMFLVKLDKAGKPIWAKGYWSPQPSSSPTASVFVVPTAIVATHDGVALGGKLGLSAKLGDLPFKDPTSGSFLAKFDGTTGATLWVSEWGTSSLYAPSAVAKTSSGNLLVVGSYSGALSLGSLVLPETTSSGAYVAKLDGTQGTFLNARGYAKSAVEDDRLYGVVVNQAGLGAEKDASLLFGGFRTTIALGAPLPPLTSASTNTAAFLAKLVP